ncbi:hypothetical protein QH948_06955 [Tessaracoccus lacteus]|uniref:DUF6933 domain-containing protein n=1 Tax=Tessaracoccus lacteus TaxID=3041766 RepID=A0ABY8Q0X5_9ACTN|nr:hypothetical protein [Tessaracoccus sp. T21]WGT48471.1 hypothetical protein QH948_06955 [Tessaracoccus sp. T21]
MPLAPARTLLQRFPDQLAELLDAHHTPPHVTAAEVAAARQVFLAAIASRSLVGSLNEFAFLADHDRNGPEPLDLLGLSLKLSRVPCGPLFKRHVSPDRELAALLHDLPPGGPVLS